MEVEYSDEEIDLVVQDYIPSTKFKILKICYAVCYPIIHILFITLPILSIVGWITCFILSLIYGWTLFMWLIVNPLIVITAITLYVVMLIIEVMRELFKVIRSQVRSGLSAIDEYERKSQQIEVHQDEEIVPPI